jgi:hypothetical protein
MHRLRGHHLICLHFFRGSYDGGFRENLKRLLEEVSEVKVVDGVDDACMACPYNKGFCNYTTNAEEEVRELDEFALKILGLGVGSRVKWEELEKRVPGIIKEWREFACRNCDWRGGCNV